MLCFRFVLKTPSGTKRQPPAICVRTAIEDEATSVFSSRIPYASRAPYWPILLPELNIYIFIQVHENGILNILFYVVFFRLSNVRELYTRIQLKLTPVFDTTCILYNRRSTAASFTISLSILHSMNYFITLFFLSVRFNNVIHAYYMMSFKDKFV